MSTSALDTAFANAARMKMAAAAAISSPTSALTGSSSAGGLIQPSSLNRAAEQYSHNRGWVYVCVNAISTRLAGADVFVGRVTTRPDGRKHAPQLSLPKCYKSLGSSIEALERHPLLDLINDPNPIMVRANLLYCLASSIKLTGWGFLWLSEDEGGKLSLWPLPAHWMTPSDNFRTSWELKIPGSVKGITLPAADVMSCYLPDPGNIFAAMSTVQTQAAGIAADEAIQTAQYRTFKNGIFPNVAVKVGRLPNTAGIDMGGNRPVLEPEQRVEIVEAVKKQFRGALAWNEPMIVDGMIEGIEKLSLNPGEMDFLDSSKLTKERIFQAFGVNPIIVGQTENANKAQAVTAEQIFLSNTVNPIGELLSQALSAWVAVRFASPGEKLICWIEPCRAYDEEQTLKEWEVGMKYGAADLNEFRTHILGLPTSDRFDVVMSPGSMIERATRPTSKALNRLEASRNGSAH